MLNDIKIGTRLWLAFGLVIASFLGIAVLCLTKMNTLSEITEKLVTHPYAVSNALRDIKANINDMKAEVELLFIAKAYSEVESYIDNIDRFEGAIIKSFDLVINKTLGDPNQVVQVRDSFSRWKKSRDKVIQLVEQDRIEEASKLFYERNISFVDNLQKELKTLINSTDAKARAFIDQAAQTYKKITYLFWIAIVAITCFSLFLTVFCIRSIVVPLRKALPVIKNLSKADFSSKIEVHGQDEMATLSKTINQMIDGLSHLLQSIQNYSDRISIYSSDLKGNSVTLLKQSDSVKNQSNNVATTTGDVAVNLSTIATAAEEMSVNTNGISSASEEMSNNIKSISDSIGSFSKMIKEISDNAHGALSISNQATEKSKSTAKAMDDLDKAAVKIGDVTGVIKRIAEQTNLLALNATIEAASAGDAGKGFAVVANEIKELANQSAKAAEDIAVRIDGIQTNTSRSIQMIQEIADVISKVNSTIFVISNSVSQQSDTAEQIHGNIEQANLGINEIVRSISEMANASANVSSNAEEAAKAANHVAKNITDVSQSADLGSVSANIVSETSTSLDSLGKELKSAADKFKLAS